MRLIDSMDRDGRFGEWMASAAMLLIGIVLALPGDTMRFSEWWAVRDLGLREVTVAAFATGVGAARMVVLYVNGQWHRTPFLRGIGSTIGMIFFALLALLSAWAWVTGSVSAPDTHPALYAIFFIADLRGCHRAGADHRAATLSL